MDLKTLHKMSLHSLQKRGVEQGSLGVEYLFILDISSYAPLSVTLLKLFYREGKGYFYYPPPHVSHIVPWPCVSMSLTKRLGSDNEFSKAKK